jgi:hypothetical protein
MIELAPSLGCGASDYACLCKNANFQYGIRDCSNEVCGSPDLASSAIAYGSGYCSCEYTYNMDLEQMTLTWN